MASRNRETCPPAGTLAVTLEHSLERENKPLVLHTDGSTLEHPLGQENESLALGGRQAV